MTDSERLDLLRQQVKALKPFFINQDSYIDILDAIQKEQDAINQKRTYFAPPKDIYD